tara:strand:+ start:839 stop:2026 length:1188 start_codon:yes stop_codon:yes gene_type:complete
MAINVNTVYQTVLLILNKEQRGYMTPVEFNKTGAQAQLEIFETYFDSLNQQIRIPQTDTDYANRVANLDEKISIFKEFGTATSISSSNVFNLPQQFSGAQSIATTTLPATTTAGATSNNNNAINNSVTMVLAAPNNNIQIGMYITAGTGVVGTPRIINRSESGGTGTGFNTFTLSATQTIGQNTVLTYSAFSDSSNLKYEIQTATADQVANGVVEVFANGILLSEASYDISGTTINFFSQPTAGQTLIVNVYPKEFYRLGDLFHTKNSSSIQELQRVGSKDLYHLLSSNLTVPTTTYPIYTYKDNKFTVYPTSINNNITVSYIRKPIAPVWNFTTGLNNQYLFNSSTSFNFELHPAEQIELILKILLYAGVVIKSPEIVQVAAQQVAQENINQQR